MTIDILLVLKYIIAASAAGLVITILLQNRSGGLGAVFGGGGSGGEAYRSKRGMEAVLYNSTIVLAIVFAIASLTLAAISA
jgi:protein translocase SecG subunit